MPSMSVPILITSLDGTQDKSWIIIFYSEPKMTGDKLGASYEKCTYFNRVG